MPSSPVLENEGAERVRFLLGELLDKARNFGAGMPFSATTPYCNTIPVSEEIRSTGNQNLEHRIRSWMRWNAMVLVLNANRDSSELGGHIASFSSAATLYDVGFNHFFHGKTDTHGGDLVYFQGHSSPGMYARAFLEGRISEEQMYKFRQESEGGGLSVISAPVADAGLLAVLHGVDGPGAVDGDLSGAFHALSGASRHGANRRTEGVGIPGRRRDR